MTYDTTVRAMTKVEGKFPAGKEGARGGSREGRCPWWRKGTPLAGEGLCSHVSNGSLESGREYHYHFNMQKQRILS